MITIEQQPLSKSGVENVLVKTYYIYEGSEVYMFTSSPAYDKLIVKGLTEVDNKELIKRKNILFSEVLLCINPPLLFSDHTKDISQLEILNDSYEKLHKESFGLLIKDNIFFERSKIPPEILNW
jgi:hypothetical protein